MVMLGGFPMVSQRTTITSDGKVSEDALYACVPAAIGACILWLEGKTAWDSTLNPDLLKDKAYGDAYVGGTDASRYIEVCKGLGFRLYAVDMGDPTGAVAGARAALSEGKPSLFTIIDPYVDTSLPQYAGWTHVCVWFGDDGSGLTALDPFIGQPVYKSYATWAALLRTNQLWYVERTMLELTDGAVANFFAANGAAWQCKKFGTLIYGEILQYYRSMGASPLHGIDDLGLPLTNEIPIEKLPYIGSKFAGLAGNGITVQFYELGPVLFDPKNLVDHRPGGGRVYRAKLYENGPGTDPELSKLQAQAVIDPAAMTKRLQGISYLAKQIDQSAAAPF